YVAGRHGCSSNSHTRGGKLRGVAGVVLSAEQTCDWQRIIATRVAKNESNRGAVCERLGHLYRLGQDRGYRKEIGASLFEFGEFIEPVCGFFVAHTLSRHDKRSDYLCDPIAKAGGIIGGV